MKSAVLKVVWKHKVFFCLSRKNQSQCPCTVAEKAKLYKHGLGEREIECTAGDLEMTREEFRDLIFSFFPVLRGAGGYQFLKCFPNSRKMEILPSITHESPLSLKRLVGGAKTFIKPLQRDIDIQDEMMTEFIEPTDECLTCGMVLPINELPEHSEICAFTV
jgi:hypothetical protein